MKEGQLRVWWCSQVPITKETLEHYKIKNIEETKKKYQELIDRDLADKNVTDNVGGLEIFEKNYEGKLEWSEYYDEEGNDIDDLMEDGK